MHQRACWRWPEFANGAIRSVASTKQRFSGLQYVARLSGSITYARPNHWMPSSFTRRWPDSARFWLVVMLHPDGSICAILLLMMSMRRGKIQLGQPGLTCGDMPIFGLGAR